METGIATR